MAAHYAERTAGDALEHAGGVPFRRDRWWWWYCGADRRGLRDGREVPPTHFELWENPEELLRQSNSNNTDAEAFRVTFGLANSIFDMP